MSHTSTLTREEYLNEAMLFIFDDIIAPFYDEDWQAPQCRASIGFTSARKNKAIAQCFIKEASADNVNEIFVTPTLNDTFAILEALTHELVHATDNCQSGHRNHFAKLARYIGLEGKLTATYAGPLLTSQLNDIIDTLGTIPHGKLSLSKAKPKQQTRMKKLECSECGFMCRTTQKHIASLPYSMDNTCPSCEEHKLAIIEQ